MKAPKILIAGLLALFTAAVAPAQETIHITGSTAYRSAVHQAILDMLGGTVSYGYSGTSGLGKASQAIFTGTVSNINVTIKTSWSGSLAGLETVAQAIPGATVNTFLVNSTPMSSGGTQSAPAVYDAPTIPEVGMEDGEQLTTIFPTPAVVQNKVGVVAFKWLCNQGAAVGLTNITANQIRELYSIGHLPLSMFTGNSNAVTTNVYALGRDWDSGTRNCAFLEAGVQTYTSALTATAVKQYQPLDAGGNVVGSSHADAIASQQIWPCDTVDFLTFCNGDGGYNSGGDLGTAMKESSPFIYVAYLGLSDATTAENSGAGATDLTYNGVAFSANNLENGPYSFWCYEYLNYLPTYATTDANGYEVANILAAQISNESLLSVGANLNLMNVTRSQEGGPIAP